MAAVLGPCSKQVKIMFIDLPSKPRPQQDPLAKQVPRKLSYLHRMRELNLVHNLQYTINASSIDNLYSRMDIATEGVCGAIIGVMGGTDSAQQAAAGFRSCRMVETPEDVSRRTMAHTGMIQVCKEDPAIHRGLPKFVWKTPGSDRASYELAAEWGHKDTPEDYEHVLVFEHIEMFRAAIEQQQHTIRCLANALSQQTVLTQLHTILRNHKVPQRTITEVCAKVASLKGLWTDEIPTHWLSEPLKAANTHKPSCVVVEEPSCSSSNSSSRGRLFFVRLGKAVAAAGVTVASMLAGRHAA